MVLAVATSARQQNAFEGIAASYLETEKRPHLITRVPAGTAMLLTAQDARRLVAGLVDEVAAAGLADVAIGVSDDLSQSGIAQGLGPARVAAEAARRERGAVRWFSDLGLGPLLADEHVRSSVWSLAAPAIQALHRADASADDVLVRALAAYLLHNGSLQATSRDLGIHRHTLKARLTRIEEVTGLSLDEAESRALLLLALMSAPFSAEGGSGLRSPGGGT